MTGHINHIPLLYTVQAVNPFPYTTIFMRAFKWNPFRFFFQGQEADAVKNGPPGHWVRQDPFAGVSMGCLASEPKGTILLASIPWPRTIPERIFFEQLTHRSLLLKTVTRGKKKRGSKSPGQQEIRTWGATTKWFDVTIVLGAKNKDKESYAGLKHFTGVRSSVEIWNGTKLSTKRKWLWCWKKCSFLL